MGRPAYCSVASSLIASWHWAMRTAATAFVLSLRRAIGETRRADPPERRVFSFPGTVRPRAARGYHSRRMVKRVLLASPRGYCAGVERAIETVERALELHGPPVFVRRQIVHNAHVVRDLESLGAVFVESEDDAPRGSVLVLSAHGVAPAVYANAAARALQTIDATCPLVTKVHVEARRYAADGYTVVLVGHAGHEEVVGTMGEAPDSIVLVESVERGRAARGRRTRSGSRT